MSSGDFWYQVAQERGEKILQLMEELAAILKSVESQNSLKNEPQVFPIVNLNGTSVESLISQTYDAHEKTDAAIAALLNMSPHGRDYQISPPGSWEAAREQHMKRIDSLVHVKKDLDALLQNLYDQER